MGRRFSHYLETNLAFCADDSGMRDIGLVSLSDDNYSDFVAVDVLLIKSFKVSYLNVSSFYPKHKNNLSSKDCNSGAGMSNFHSSLSCFVA